MFNNIDPEARAILRDSYDRGDVWGWSMSHHFAIAELMHAARLDIPAEWEFHPSPFVYHVIDSDSEVYPDCEWIEAWLSGRIDSNDLLYVGNILHRYEKILEKAGRSY